MTEEKKPRAPMSLEEQRELAQAFAEAMPLLRVIMESECPRCLGTEDDPFFDGPDGEAVPCYRCRGSGLICPACRKPLVLTIEGLTLVRKQCECNEES